MTAHFCQAFPGTFWLDLKCDSSPWALHVTKDKTDSQKRVSLLGLRVVLKSKQISRFQNPNADRGKAATPELNTSRGCSTALLSPSYPLSLPPIFLNQKKKKISFVASAIAFSSPIFTLPSLDFGISLQTTQPGF